MNIDPSRSIDGRTSEATASPSAEFINAISEFFDTDPNDLLVELGYYQREEEAVSGPAS